MRAQRPRIPFDVLAARLDAESLVLPGYGHTVQQHPEFNERLADFVLRAETLAVG